ncbi:unnamed protein product [Effrenium voratum]|uniref:NAD(P)-binding domain-containing protein n=1 Tax=Effrenium voratum TaxID=2562239 RepID=A0AA36HV23_9DINO|nr:unnamed protein product [Effrenium voratum]CAJ1414505.1 unnamed protein product [Effrenium voratum]
MAAPKSQACFLLTVLFVGFSCAFVNSSGRFGRSCPRTVTRAAAADRPVVAVVGANGRTGSLAVEAIAKGGLAKARALTRSGNWQPEDASINQEQFEVGQADVTDASSLAAAFAGVAAVVFAAAYSRGKTKPQDVDNAGLVNCAKAVLEQGVERLVVVSSASVTRPYAPVGILLNTIGSGVLSEKLEGEDKVKELFEGSESSYTIVRPGGLTMEPPAGFVELQFNQGDTYVGSVPRADVAAVCAVAASDPLNSGANKTFEMFKGRGRSPLLPWYRGKTRYMVGGVSDCSAMLARLRPDKEVYDIPGALPIGLADFEMVWARPK